MLRQFKYDLEKANLFETGCLRGLEFHMEKNGKSPRSFSKKLDLEQQVSQEISEFGFSYLSVEGGMSSEWESSKK